VRGTLKGWQKFWCVVKPGMLLIYKSAKVLQQYYQVDYCFGQLFNSLRHL